jgi:hypothetical protein
LSKGNDILGKSWQESVILPIIVILGLMIMYFLYDGEKWVQREYEEMNKAIINKLDDKISIQLREIFPPQYFQQGTDP